MDQQALLALIAETVRAYSLTMRAVDSPVGPDTQLFGPSGVLDSLGLVSVVVELEQTLTDRSGSNISLMDDRAMSQTRSPFRTVRSLAEYALAQLPDSGAL
jgi:acyl carrier protein